MFHSRDSFGSICGFIAVRAAWILIWFLLLCLFFIVSLEKRHITYNFCFALILHYLF